MRNILYFIIFALAASSIAWGGDYGISYYDEPYQSQGMADSISGIPPLPVGLKFVTDSTIDDTVGRITAHQVGFQLPAYTFNSGGLLRGRQAVMTFPPEFQLTTIDAVTYRDTDSLSPDPQITWVYVYSQSVVVRFSEEIPGPNGPYFVYITFHSITNAIASDNYRITVKIDNTYGQTVAGPTFSDFFALVPDAPHSLELLPKEDTTLMAGDGILFDPRVLDQYGNRVDAGPVTLSLDPTRDMIGRLQGYYFMATTVGVGRALAGLGDLNAASGEITVTPGPPAVLNLSLEPDTVIAGDGLHHEVTVSAADLFGNRVTGYDKSIMFFSDDPLAEIVHDQNNPYQFVPDDQGRKTFTGGEFVFKTAGQRTLRVTDGTLAGENSGIFVGSAGLAGFDVSLPQMVRAGDTITIDIANARDTYGNPFYGILTVACQQIAPDGSYPVTRDIVVYTGAGTGWAMLPKAGIDTVMISGNGFVKQIPVEVLPAEAALFEIELDPTQFVGPPFRGTSSVTANDRFRNLKTDLLLPDGAAITADNGQIIPGAISDVQFIGGVCSLSDYRYEGVPGPVTLTVTAPGAEGTIVGQASFVANGLIIGEEPYGRVPATAPQNWSFRLQGAVRNPGNITPEKVICFAGFTEADSFSTLHLSQSDCLPQPGDQTGCTFLAKPALIVWPAPGLHDFIIRSRSLYVIDGDSVEIVNTVTHPVNIVPFAPFTVIATDLPDTVLQGESSTEGSIIADNPNSFPYPAALDFHLSIIEDAISFTVGNTRSQFTWPPQTTIPSLVRINETFPSGTYQYGIRYSLTVSDSIAGYLTYNSARETLTTNLVIAPRAVYEVSPQSVTPTRVTVGTQVPFAFDLMLDGVTTTVLDGAKCLLTLTDGSVSSSARLMEEAPVLNPGPNRMTAQSMTIPSSWLGKSITGRLRLIGVEAGRAAVDTELTFPFPIIVEALPGIQVLSLDLNALNPPYVNTGGHFSLTARIINRSAVAIPGPVNVKITSDGRTIPPDRPIGTTLEDIPPGDTVLMAFLITADTMPNPAEVFTITIEPSGEFIVLPAVDNQAAIVIQSPVMVALTPGSVSIPNAVAYLDYGEPFEVVVRFEHADLSRVVGGSLALNYSGPGDFGVSFPIEKPLDTVMVWNMTAPDLDINSSFSITWQQIPFDRNSGLQMTGLGGPITLSFAVRASITKLVIDARSLVTAPLQRGVTTPVFQMDVQNVTNDTRNKVHLKTLTLTFTDRDGRPVDAAGIIADSGSAFYSDGAEITTLNFGGGKANFHFSNLIIAPGQKAELELRLTVKKDAALDYFSLQLTGDDFSAEIAEGPRVGQTVPVYGLLDKPFSISLPQAVIAENLGESFKNYPNPFNPEIEQTEIRYYLPTASDVDIIVFTATGEKVREMHFDAGGEGGRAGVNGGVFWDGRNGEGDVVLNGVYVAIIKVAEGDLAAKVKIAVVK